jgi:C-terminal processing protease CtpA/Prc
MRKMLLALLLLTGTLLVAEEPQGWHGIGITRHKQDGEEWLIVRFHREGGPAEKSGLAADDVVTAIDGKKLRFRDDLDFLEFLGRLKPGQRVKLTVLRNQKTQHIMIKTMVMPSDVQQRWKANLEYARKKRAMGTP